MKNNAPRYVLLDYNLLRQNSIADDLDVDAAASRILAKHIKAFEELGKGGERNGKHRRVFDMQIPSQS